MSSSESPIGKPLDGGRIPVEGRAAAEDGPAGGEGIATKSDGGGGSSSNDSVRAVCATDVCATGAVGVGVAAGLAGVEADAACFWGAAGLEKGLRHQLQTSLVSLSRPHHLQNMHRLL